MVNVIISTIIVRDLHKTNEMGLGKNIDELVV